jgi:kumamolisin
MAQAHVPLAGSGRSRKAGTVRVGDVDPGSPVEVTVTVRRPELPDVGAPLARDELERGYSAASADLIEIRQVLGRFGLAVRSQAPLTGSLVVTGSAAQIEAAFHPRLGMYRTAAGGEIRGRETDVKIPAQLDGIVTGVFGLDQRRVAHRRMAAAALPVPPGAAGAPPWGPAELESHYRFPAGDCSGQTIAIAEFGGGFYPDDVRMYCDSHSRPLPQISTVPVGLTPLTPARLGSLSTAQQAEALGESGEVMMDVEIVAGLCPQAQIVVLFAPFHQKGWIDLLDRVLAMDPPPVALSVSWGLAEDAPDWTPAARQAINERLHTSALLGTTVCAATGDDGAGDQVPDGRAHVHFPASSPFVLAVGGTMLDGEDEVVWWNVPGDRSQHGGGSTGGGVSVEFARPAWQRVRRVRSLNADGIDGRIVPDVAALAGLPAYGLVFNGQSTLNGGTSAAAPVWASLIARIAARHGGKSLPFLAPLLYQPGRDRRVRGRAAFTDIRQGDNISPTPGRGYRAREGYDAVSGWGVPDGEKLLAAL